jgi:outer membrane protein assembly factor BamB
MSIVRVFCRLICALAFFLLSFGVALAAPAVTLSPPGGPPTTAVIAAGTGFGATQLVDIYFDTTDLCLADAAGAFSCTIKVPASAQPQTHWITAAQRSSGLAAQKAFSVRTDWAQFHGQNAKHTGFNPFENTLDAANVANLDILWRASVGPMGTYSTPVVALGRVYIGGADGKLYVFNAKNGAAIAGFPKTLGGFVVDSSAAVGQGKVYIGTSGTDHKLYAFDAITGAAIAGFPVTVGNDIRASSTLSDGKVYVAAADGKIYAFDAATGAGAAGFPVTVGAAAGLYATVSAANGRIYVGSQDGKLYAFDAVTGAGIAGYPKTTGNEILSAAAIVSGQVFFGSFDFALYGLRAHNGANLSGYPATTSAAVAGGPAVGDGMVIVGSEDHNIYSYSTGGVGNWVTLLDAAVDSSPVIANKVVYVNSASSLYALKASDGTILWRAAVSTTDFASPAVSDGTVYLGSSDGNLYAFSVNGLAPASRLPGGELGIRAAPSSLKPNYALKPRTQ